MYPQCIKCFKFKTFYTASELYFLTTYVILPDVPLFAKKTVYPYLYIVKRTLFFFMKTKKKVEEHKTKLKKRVVSLS